MYEIECVVTGVVQGVAYRAYVEDAARELSLAGLVKNQSDGSVLVIAQGTTDVLKEFIEYLHEGSLHAKVTGVSVDWRTAKTVYDEFSIRYV